LKIIYTIANGPSDEDKQDNWKGERGYINKAMLMKDLTRNELDNSMFYNCGPTGMLKAMQKLLELDLNIPKQRIILSLLGTSINVYSVDAVINLKSM
jgi:Na+-transporting NADH:ubiquinone oxidoreductase subunit NqrF